MGSGLLKMISRQLSDGKEECNEHSQNSWLDTFVLNQWVLLELRRGDRQRCFLKCEMQTPFTKYIIVIKATSRLGDLRDSAQCICKTFSHLVVLEKMAVCNIHEKITVHRNGYRKHEGNSLEESVGVARCSESAREE